MVRRMYGERESRIHLDDLRLYVQRPNNQEAFSLYPPPQHFLGEKEAPIPIYHVERLVMVGAMLLGQRSLDLTWPL